MCVCVFVCACATLHCSWHLANSHHRGESELPQVPCEAEVAVRTLTPEDCRSARDRAILPESCLIVCTFERLQCAGGSQDWAIVLVCSKAAEREGRSQGRARVVETLLSPARELMVRPGQTT